MSYLGSDNMFQKYDACNFYYYKGLYLSEEMLKSKDLEIEKATGFGIIYQLRNYEQVYSYEGEFKEVDKQQLLVLLSSPSNKYKEFCYRIRNGNFILLPIEIFYGISDSNGDLILYYKDQAERDEKIAYMNQYGINEVINDLNNAREKAAEFNRQRQLRKVYNILTMTIE